MPGPAATHRATGGGLDPAALLKPLADSWPTYSGDYTGRRYSALNADQPGNVKNLTLAWVARVNPGLGDAGGGGGGGGGRGGRRRRRRRRRIVGGEGTGDFACGGGAEHQGRDPEVDDVLYVTAPDNVWALDARDGRDALAVLLEDARAARTSATAAPALWHNYLFFETPDNYLVSLDAKTGKERWHVEIAGLQPAVLLHHGADRHRQSRAGRHRATTSTRRVSCSRSIR